VPTATRSRPRAAAGDRGQAPLHAAWCSRRVARGEPRTTPPRRAGTATADAPTAAPTTPSATSRGCTRSARPACARPKPPADVDERRRSNDPRPRQAIKNSTAWWIAVRHGKRGRTRSVPLDDDALRAIIAWVKNRPASTEHLLLSLPRTGQPGPLSTATSPGSLRATPLPPTCPRTGARLTCCATPSAIHAPGRRRRRHRGDPRARRARRHPHHRHLHRRQHRPPRARRNPMRLAAPRGAALPTAEALGETLLPSRYSQRPGSSPRGNAVLRGPVDNLRLARGVGGSAAAAGNTPSAPSRCPCWRRLATHSRLRRRARCLSRDWAGARRPPSGRSHSGVGLSTGTPTPFASGSPG
jgi:hypothetical protein